MGNSNKNIFIIIGAVLLVAIAAFLFWPGKDGSGSKKGKDLSSKTDPTQGGGISEDGTSVDGSSSGGDGKGVTPEFLLEQFKEWAQYPPYSRPMSNLNADLVEPFFVQESPIVMFDSPTSKEPNGYRCYLQPKNYAVIGLNSTMYITMECRDNVANSATPVKVQDARMFRDFDGQRFSAVKPDFNDDGRDGDETAKDNIITFNWRPMKNDWGDMTLEADIVYGKEGKKAKVTSTFFSSPHKPAEFTGTFRENLNDGSLSIYATIQVLKAGNYHLEANLKEAAEGNYLAYATFDGELKTGTQEVEFVFFGKIFRDKGFEGPYLVTDVRGHRVNLPIDPAWNDQGEEGLKKIQAAKTTEPDKELVIPFKDEYKTKPYTLSQFSKKPWESADKNNRIKELEQLARESK